MKTLLVAGLLGAVLAQYGGPGHSPPSYPSAPAPPGHGPPVIIPWTPSHYHDSYSRSDSRSWSRSDSRERKEKCRNCKNLKKLRSSSNSTLVAPKISYLTDKKDCVQAVIRCPFDNRNYTLYVGNDIDDNEAISTGFYIERTVKCNHKGKWQIDVPSTSDKYRFKYAGCQKHELATTATTASPPTTSAPSVCNRCDPARVDLTATSPDSSPTPTNGLAGSCTTLVLACDNPGDTLQDQDGSSIGTGSPAEATLVCNAAGAWILNGAAVTAATCSVPPLVCNRCDPDGIDLTAVGTITNSYAPTSEVGDDEGDCTTLVVTCDDNDGETSALISLDGSTRLTLGTGTPAEATLVCNTAGGWTSNDGSAVTQATCSPACTTCQSNQIELSEDDDDLNTLAPTIALVSSEQCSTFTITCPDEDGNTLSLNEDNIAVTTLEVVLDCDSQGQWTYSGDSGPISVTSATCSGGTARK